MGLNTSAPGGLVLSTFTALCPKSAALQSAVSAVLLLLVLSLTEQEQQDPAKCTGDDVSLL